MTTKGIEPQSQWLFTEEEIRNSPSILDGLPVAEEVCRRAKGVNFIIQAGILLKIPQLTLGTASVFFHRFYMRYSMVAEKGGIHHYVRSSLPRSKFSGSLNNPLI
jgi:protein BUR2